MKLTESIKSDLMYLTELPDAYIYTLRLTYIKEEGSTKFLTFESASGHTWEFNIADITRYESLYVYNGFEDTVNAPWFNNARSSLIFQLLNAVIDPDWKIFRKSKINEKLLEKWEYAKKFNAKSKLIHGGILEIINGKLTICPLESSTDIIVPKRVGKYYYESDAIRQVTQNSKIDFRIKNYTTLKVLSDVDIPVEFTAETFLEKVEILGDIKHLNPKQFDSCVDLREISLPDSIVSLGKSCFCGCQRLKSIKLPKELVGLEESTFNDCYLLNSVEFNDKLEYVRSSAFSNCRSLVSLRFPEGTTDIDISLYGCQNLQIIDIPYSCNKLNIEADGANLLVRIPSKLVESEENFKYSFNNSVEIEVKR